jgi:hypothetical protein
MPVMTKRPVLLPPASPSELLSYILNGHRYPTTLLIGASKQQFLQSLLENIKTPLETSDQSEDGPHALLQATLYQVAVSRHIRIAFIPTVTHLRAYLAAFSSESAPVCAPPVAVDASSEPLLLVYGFLELHRLTSEWSAQGIGDSAAALVEAASSTGDHYLRAAIIEPTGGAEEASGDGREELVPVLSGMSRREDGSWIGRAVQARRILERWFEENGDKNG